MTYFNNLWRALCNKPQSIENSVKILCNNLEQDSDYKKSWISTIAVNFIDKATEHKKANKPYLSFTDIHKVANEAAEEFIIILCKNAK